MSEIRQIQEIMLETAHLVALAVCRMMSPKSDMLSTRRMFEEYDRGWLVYHIGRGNLKGTKTGSAKNAPILWSRLEIEALREAEKIGPKLNNSGYNTPEHEK